MTDLLLGNGGAGLRSRSSPPVQSSPAGRQRMRGCKPASPARRQPCPNEGGAVKRKGGQRVGWVLGMAGSARKVAAAGRAAEQGAAHASQPTPSTLWCPAQPAAQPTQQPASQPSGRANSCWRCCVTAAAAAASLTWHKGRRAFRPAAQSGAAATAVRTGSGGCCVTAPPSQSA